MPKTYQEYLNILLHEIKQKTPLKILSYSNEKEADYNVTPSSLRRKLHKPLSKLTSALESNKDIRIMHNYDIIHLQHSYLFIKLGPFFNGAIKKPVIVITLRGADTYLRPWVYEKWKIFYSAQSQYIDAFITVSQHQKDYLQRWGVSESKIHVIPISLGSKTISAPKYPSDTTIKIISAHRMCWEKNINGNLRTVKLLKEAGYNVQYDIYGDGPDKAQVSYLIDKYNLEFEANYRGEVDNTTYKKKLLDYDIFLQLSHSESFGASVIEAQSMGLPVIISNSDGLPETIVEGESGFCVDPNNSEEAASHIIDLFTDREKYYSFSEQGIRYSNANFSSDIEADKLIKLYNALMLEN